VFGNVLLERDSYKLIFGSEKVEARARPLSDSMMGYWANFARTGDPNGPDLPEWPAYNADTRLRIHFDTEITVNPLPDDQHDRYQYWANKKISTSDLRL